MVFPHGAPRLVCNRSRYRHFFCALGTFLIAFGIATPASNAQVANAKPGLDRLKSMSLEELLDTTVTSVSRTPEKLSDTASAIQVISEHDIVRSGATSLPEALRLANNLNVAQKNSRDWGISARGFNTDLSNKLLVMIDGRTVYTPLFSGVRWDAQDYLLADLDRIEVISGPGGALWGANAVNGVINITSKSAAQTQGVYAEASVGDRLDNAFAVRYGGTIAPNVSYRVYAKRFERDDQSMANGDDAGDAWDSTQAGFRIDAKQSTENSFTLQGDTYQGKEGFLSGEQSDIDGSNLLGRWNRTLSEDSDLSLQVYYDRAHFRQPVAQSAFGPAGFFADTMETYDLDFQNRVTLPAKRKIVWGFGYRHTKDRTNSAPTLAFDPANLNQELFSGFAQLEFELFRAVTFAVGTKIEHNDYTGWEAEPSIRLDWKPNAYSTLWSAVSRAVRTPSRVDRDIREPASAPIILAGSSDFSSEHVLAYELGYRTRFNDTFSLSAAGFLNYYDHIRSVSRTPVTVLPFYFSNDLEGKTYGAEITANYQVVRGWRLLAAYTRLIEDIKVTAGGSDLNNALNETADPKQQWSIRSAIDLAKNVDLDANLRRVDSLRSNNNGSVGVVPSYTELDCRAAWRFTPNLEFALVGQNLLHAHHVEFGAPSLTRIEIARNFYAKATWYY